MKKHTKTITAIILIVVFATICTCVAIWTLKQPKELSSSPTENTSSNSLESLEESNSETQSPINESSIETNSEEQHTSTPQNNTSSQNSSSESSKLNDSSGIVFNDESVHVLTPGGELLPIREAYEKGYIRIKIINGIAYKLGSINGVDYIGPADIDKGISYDGESPIIYTYPDGTTGTEKRDGATYEYMPGIKHTINFLKDLADRLAGEPCPDCGKEINLSSKNGYCSHTSRDCYCRDCGIWLKAYTCHDCVSGNTSKYYCSTCGKESGDGTKETCVRWSFGDVDCPVCGENVPQNTCHTCAKGCKICGKTPGDGTNGTCYRDCFGTSNCPSCGAKVPHNTCHMCGE